MEQRLIDANALSKRLQYLIRMRVYDAFDCLNEIDAAPTIDAVPVVRCKDCVHCRKSIFYDWMYLCDHERLDIAEPVELEHFCGYGERKGND